jgi:hypothetical protein
LPSFWLEHHHQISSHTPPTILLNNYSCAWIILK